MLRHEPQRDPLARARDEDRQPANRRRVEQLEPPLDERQRLRECAPARPVRAELVAVLVVVAAEPPGSDPEHEPPAGDVVDRARHVGEQLRVAVRVAAHERPQLDARRLLRPGGEERPALEVRAVALPVEREEVIPRVEEVGADLLDPVDGAAQRVVGAVLRVELDGDPDRPHCRSSSSSDSRPEISGRASSRSTYRYARALPSRSISRASRSWLR